MSSTTYMGVPAQKRGGDAAARRALDIVVALAALLLAALPMLVIAAAICLDSPGPVLFSQTRIGRHGRPFRLHKFRKFVHGSAGGPAVTLKDDPRMTRMGRVLERFKLDELPQICNVLGGSMALVGPRPETLDFADRFTGEARRLLDYAPGLFGPNQVLFRHECLMYPAGEDPHRFYRAVLFPAKAGIDLAYFPNRTLGSDLRWVALGVLAAAGLLPESPPASLLAGRLDLPHAGRAAATEAALDGRNRHA